MTNEHSVDWTFWSAQMDAITAVRSGEHDIVNFRAGYGSGKSVLGARLTHEYARSIPKSDNLVTAQDSAKGQGTTYKVLFEQLPGEDTVPEEDGDPENSPWISSYSKKYGGGTLTYVNGSVVRLGSADKWNRYAGGEFNFIWNDEVAHYENTDLDKLIRMLISRQRTADGPNVTLWTSTGNGYNQYYDVVERQVFQDGTPLPVRLTNVVADSRDNPFLPEKEKLVRLFEGTASEDQGLAGGFAAPEGLVYSRFSRTSHVVRYDDIKDQLVDGWRVYGYDAGWNDPMVVVEIAKTHYDQRVVVDCFYASEQPIERVTGEGGWMDGKTRGTVYCEHEPAHIRKFQYGGYHAVKAEKSLDEGIPYVRGLLEPDESGRPGLLVCERCDDVIQEFLSYQEDEVGKSGAEDHALDSLRYALFTDSVRGGSGYIGSF